ncbi:hypothetical protein HNR42_001355 [Deinobacterium chartae]|uniref:Lipoprotein n=1 Tax=Deinobacterium chartae TaxID=521158 RepID=A0A841I1I5_9DEIO|nr:hypothetical protein [Deinobacterium chartae]MBB6097932.1 hypothetical protein [Deinobacterium chartae]
MKHLVLTLLLPGLLAACTVTTTTYPGGSTSAVVISLPSSRSVLNVYPGAYSVRRTPVGLGQVEFSVNRASTRQVFDHYDRQLRSQGWARRSQVVVSGRIEGRYYRGSSELRLEVYATGPGRYLISFD